MPSSIWLINPYGPIPSEGWRDYRFTLLGKELAARGHDVLWWTANFSHHFKRFRSPGWHDIEVCPHFQIQLAPTTGYDRNIGLGRVRFETVYAANVYRRARGERRRPRAIVGIDPPQTIGYLSTQLARAFGAPLLLDVFDLWPELFTLAFPRALRRAAPFVLAPLYWLRRRNLHRCQALSSLCKTYMTAAGRLTPHLGPNRRLISYNGIDVTQFRALMPPPGELQQVEQELGKRSGEVWAIYAGSLGNNYDIATLLKAATRLKPLMPHVRVLVAGDGPLRPLVESAVSSNPGGNLSYLGKLSHEQLARLYAVSDIGICAYGPLSNVAMPDKAYDYMAAGLPIVNSLTGELQETIDGCDMGRSYRGGDAQSLADAIAGLASDSTQRQRQARNALETACLFDSKIQYGRFADFIEAVLLS